MVRLDKFHSYGNAYLAALKSDLAPFHLDRFVRLVCDPHFGVGSDGLVLVRPLEGNRFELRVFNPDGSQAEMSGNGGRCAAAFIHRSGLSDSPRLIFETPAGEKSYERLDRADAEGGRYRSRMGEPSFFPADIPMQLSHPVEEVLDVPFRLGSETLRISALSVGNPQCVVLDAAGLDWKQVGAGLSRNPAFPQGTNVSFILSSKGRRIEIRIWERGVGPTYSSGTGCCGAAVAALAQGLVRSPVEVVTETGEQLVEWQPGESIELTGDVSFIAEIRFQPEVLRSAGPEEPSAAASAPER